MLRKFITYLLIVLLLIILPLSLVGSLRDTATTLVSPLAEPLVGLNIRIRENIRSIRQISQLRQERVILQEENVRLQQKVVDFESLKRENEALRNELGISGVSREYHKVFARVVVRPPTTSDPTFVIDLGSSSGVKVGQPAIHQGALIGRVISVRENSATVRTITSKESRIQAWISESREKGLLIGDGSAAYLSDITQGIPVALGSVVETSGLGGSLPQGLVIGQLGSVQSKESDVSQKFLLTLNQDPTNIESVFILLTDSPS